MPFHLSSLFHHDHAPPPGPPPHTPSQGHYQPHPGPPPGPQSSHGFNHPSNAPPPEWTSTTAVSDTWGLLSDASDAEYQAAEKFCEVNPVSTRHFIRETWRVQEAKRLGWGAWGLEVAGGDLGDDGGRFKGTVTNGHVSDGHDRNPFHLKPGTAHVATTRECPSVCLLSTLPILPLLPAGTTQHGVYFEIRNISTMSDAIALGTVCKPYPHWRLPGWNRLSVGLHLDDGHTFFADPDGGVAPPHPSPLRTLIPSNPDNPDPARVRGKVFGCGIDLRTTGVFFTVDGVRLPDSYKGVYPRGEMGETEAQGAGDVYAAVGVSGEASFSINFGGEPFAWEAANNGGWLAGLGLPMAGEGTARDGESLPGYQN